MKPTMQDWHKPYLKARVEVVLEKHPRLVLAYLSDDFDSRCYEVGVRLREAPDGETCRVLVDPKLLERCEMKKSSDELDQKLDSDFHRCFPFK